MSTDRHDNAQLFIPEREDPVFTRIFYWYVLSLYRRRFRAVWLDDRRLPRTRRATLYIGNHNAWWDALTPLLINERVIGKRARALMEEQQLRRYPFFRRLGVFSIDRRHPRRALASMEHAVDLLNGSGHRVDGDGAAENPSRSLPWSERPVGLWFYPEGKLVGPDMPVAAENGIAWLARKLDPGCTEIIPFASHIHHMRGDKPELFVRMGPALDHGMFAAKGGAAAEEPSTEHQDPAWQASNPVQEQVSQPAARVAEILEELRASARRDSAVCNADGHPEGGFRLLLGRPYGSLTE